MHSILVLKAQITPGSAIRRKVVSQVLNRFNSASDDWYGTASLRYYRLGSYARTAPASATIFCHEYLLKRTSAVHYRTL